MKDRMRRKRIRRFLLGLIMLLVLAAVRPVTQEAAPEIAQEPERRPVESDVPSRREPRGRRPGTDGRPRRPALPSVTGASNALLEEMRLDEEPIKGAPYGATAVTESVQTLGDGTRITNRTTAKLWRDGEGRMRREQSLNFAGSFAVASLAAPQTPQLVIIINDVVAHQRYVLEPETRTAQRMMSNPGSAPLNLAPPESAQGKTEALGKKLMEGLTVEGTRSTITIPAGQIGNDRPIHIVSERWTSPELKTVVLSRHKDPRVGETTYRLTSISRQEPDKSLFEVPAEYQMRRFRLRATPGRMPARRGVPNREMNR